MPDIEKYMSPRLEMIASLVPRCDCVCDIGTDHGYIPVYLIKSGRAKRAVASDINKGPLLRAEENVRLFDAISAVSLRLSDGFSSYAYGEVDSAVIAGMGGETISGILKKDIGTQYFILQPQTAHKELRSFLFENGYKIVDEAISCEGNKMYTAMLATRGKMSEMNECELEIGPVLIKKRPPLFDKYVKYRMYEIETILSKIKDSSAQERFKSLSALLNEYKNLIG